MLGFLIVAGVVAWQNPIPPDVKLPEGWRVHYWGSAGYGTGALLGPKGEEILFPGYVPTGAMAATTKEALPSSLFVKVLLDGRLVEVAVKSDGFIAVSYPPVPRPNVPGWQSFDYWTTAKGADEAANALMIALTRLEVPGARDRNAEALSDTRVRFASGTQEFPFDGLSVTPPCTFGSGPPIGFMIEKGVTVYLDSKASTEAKWKVERSLLGRSVSWGEDRSGHAWATVSAPGRYSNRFVSSAATPKAIVLAILMALTYNGS